ncbi:GIY-YIG nuclease family protein, partial [Gluconobacter sp. DsW_058]|uniref:GIY-YIG nuclease family protein n=2 Tax=Gluconobacter TaxID=441 RepID=UPI001E60DECC
KLFHSAIPPIRSGGMESHRKPQNQRVLRSLQIYPIWVGSTPDLSKIQNQLWFTLRLGSHPHRSLQDAWTAHEGDTFSFEVIEELKGKDNAYIRSATLKELLAKWTAELKAVRL